MGQPATHLAAPVPCVSRYPWLALDGRHPRLWSCLENWSRGSKFCTNIEDSRVPNWQGTTYKYTNFVAPSPAPLLSRYREWILDPAIVKWWYIENWFCWGNMRVCANRAGTGACTYFGINSAQEILLVPASQFIILRPQPSAGIKMPILGPCANHIPFPSLSFVQDNFRPSKWDCLRIDPPTCFATIHTLGSASANANF